MNPSKFRQQRDLIINLFEEGLPVEHIAKQVNTTTKHIVVTLEEHYSRGNMDTDAGILMGIKTPAEMQEFFNSVPPEDVFYAISLLELYALEALDSETEAGPFAEANIYLERFALQ